MTRLFDVPWISHDGGGIFSIDIHPLGKKLATAGQDQSGAGLLVIWPLDFIFQPKEQLLESESFNFLSRIAQPKTVNCVRWSPPIANDENSGQRLVCGGDDPTLCIFEWSGTYTSHGTLGSSSTSKSLESYRCVQKLYGHSLDVMHVDWSPDGKYIASCSLDNTIIVWNVLKLPEKVAVLKFSNGGHDRGVKGLSWDPLGRFLSTQADDKALKIWRTDSWECVQTFTEPFSESAGTALFSRMDWSPNGSYLICPCAMNNGGPTAKVLCRKDWSCQRDLVGFRKAVTCVRANPRCFYATNSAGKRVTVSCFATGSRDRSLAVWLVPSFSRPLIVLNKLFKLSIIDLSWNNLTLAACSREGTVKLLRFTEREIGDVLSSHEMANLTENLYGFRPQIHETKDQSVLDENFVFSSWLKSMRLSKNKKFAPNNGMEIKKCSDKQLYRMILKARFQRKEKESPKPISSITKENKKRKTSWIQKTDTKLFKTKSTKKSPTDDVSSYENFSGFSLPEQKRIIFVNVQQWRKSNPGVAAVEVLNQFYLCNRNRQSNQENTCTRITGYNPASKEVWTVFTPAVVSMLASNSFWTLVSTFDGRLMCLSTATGRLLFCATLQPICIMMLTGNNCMVVDCRGLMTCWNLLKCKCRSSQSISQLFNRDSCQLIAPLLTGGEDRPSVMFTDHHSFSASPDGWTVAANGVGTTVKEFFAKLGCVPPSMLFPPQIVASKNIASDMNSLCRMLDINVFHNLDMKSCSNDKSKKELEKMLIKAVDSGSASQTRFLGSVYALRLAATGKQCLKDFFDQLLLRSDQNEKALEMHSILSQIFQEYIS